jgi:hypothetical protein
MKITIDHDHCQHGGEFADRCLAATIRNPLGHERFCMAQVDEDGQPELTVVLVFDGEEHTLILHDQRERDIAASLGWPAFLNPTV